MEKKKQYFKKAVGFMILLGFMIACIASSSAGSSAKSYDSWSGSDGQRALQHAVQASNGGIYVGKFSSEAEAKRAAANAGFSAYNYYYETGECFGY